MKSPCLRPRHLLFLLLILPLGPALAQADLAASAPLDFITKFQDVYVDDAGTGFAVGTCGVIRRTGDSGQTWTTFTAPANDDFASVACPPGGCATALVVGEEGLFRLAGGQWAEVTFPDFQFSGQLHWPTADVVILETGGENYYRSTDGGLTWTQTAFPGNQESNLFFLDGATAYVFLDSALYKTADSGATFAPVGFKHTAPIYDQTWLDADRGWFFDSKRLFYGTTDGGMTWTLLNATSQLTSVTWFVALSATHLVGAQVTTQRIESLDGGVTWSRGPFLADGNERVNERYHRRGGEFFTVGDESQLLYSAAGFTDFTELDPPAVRWPRVEGMGFAAADVGYVLTRFQFHTTTDAGLSWTTTELPEQSFEMAVLATGDPVFLNAKRGMISRDGGATVTDWIPAGIVPEGEQPTRFARKPDGSLYLYGSAYGLTSTDEGQTFTAINHGTAKEATTVHFPTNSTGYFATRQNEIGKTTDGGLTWTVTEGPARNLVDLYFTDADNGWASTASNRWVTADGGLTWRTDFREGGYDFVAHPTDGSLLAARYTSGNNGAVVRSTDGGASWRVLTENCFAYRAGAVTPDGKYYWTGGDGGFWVRHDLPALIASTGTWPRRNAPSAVLRAFPNPTTDRVTVAFPAADRAVVQLLDAAGRSLHLRPAPAAATRMTLDLAPFPPGIYLLRWTDGRQTGRVRILRQ